MQLAQAAPVLAMALLQLLACIPEARSGSS